MTPQVTALSALIAALTLPVATHAVESQRNEADGRSLTRTQGGLVTPDSELNEVTVKECWVRQAPLPELPTAAYFVVDNESHLTLELTGVQTDAFERAELRQTVTGDGPARMLTISSVPVAPGDTQKFAPGGYHVLLAEPTQALEVESNITLTFLFGTDGRSPVPCRVQAATQLNYGNR